MIEMNVPGRGIFQIEYLVCDVNGTLAVDGILLPRLKTALQKNSRSIKVYLKTANTHRNQKIINNESGWDWNADFKFDDIVVNNGLDGISLLQHPMRMVAALRK